MKRLSKKEILKKKEQDKQAIIKILVGFVLMMALITWGGGLFAISLPVIVGISLLPNDGTTLKDKWNKMGKKQKGLFALVVLILLPFLIVGLMWVALIGSLILIDILFFLPIFLIIAWFIFRNPKNQSNEITAFLGSYYSLAIGVVLLVVIIGMATYNYYQYQQEISQGNTDMSKQMNSIINPDASGEIHFQPIYLPNGTEIDEAKINPNRTINVVIKVTDILTPAWLKQSTSTPEVLQFLNYSRQFYTTNLSSNESVYNNTDPNKTTYVQHILENITLHGYGDPIQNAQVSLEGNATANNIKGKPAGSKIIFQQPTDQNGIVRFKNVREGLYILKVKAYGYREYIREFPVTEKLLSGRIFSVPLVPDYYKVRLHWRVSLGEESTPFGGSWLVPFANFKHYIQDDNTTFISFGSSSGGSGYTAMSDKEIVTSAFKIEKDMFMNNSQRIESMYGWSGITNPNSPLYGLSEHMLFVQNELYSQSIYLSPTTSQNIYSVERGHLIGLIIVIAIAVATAYLVGTYYSSAYYYAKVTDIYIGIIGEANADSESGANPQVWIFSLNGGEAHVNSVTLHYSVDKIPTNSNKGDNYVYRDPDNRYIEGTFTFVVWGKDVPANSNIYLHATMKIIYVVYEKKGGSFVATSNNQAYSVGLDDKLVITTGGTAIQNTK